MATTQDEKPRRAAVPVGWFAQYVIGSAIVIGLFVGGLITTMHTVGNLADEVRAATVASCGAQVDAGCRADYGAEVLDVHHGSNSTRMSLRTSFLSDTNADDQCFGQHCLDVVRLRSGDGTTLTQGSRVTIDAGARRIYQVRSAATVWPTYDNPSLSLLSTSAGLVWALYLDAFAVSWLVAYIFMTLAARIGRVTVATIRRGLNIVTVISAVGSIITFVAFANGAARGLVLLGTGLLLTASAGAIARRHPAVQHEIDFQPNQHWRAAANRSVVAAVYVLVAFPLPIAVSVALLLLHDDATFLGPVIAILIGAAGAAVLVYRTHRSLTKDKRAPAVARPSGTAS